ncbi:MAG: cache domain-containing protein [Deltaproteobacteria bacterium]|nr:cache domain-containing protein [Deltaproteobacteria bacterium]
MPPMRFSIRLKLTIGALLPLFVAILVCSLVGIYTINSSIVSQAQEKVRTDLNSAREVYLNEVAHIRDVVKLTADAPFTATALASGRQKALSALLAPLRGNERLDILTAVGRDGRVLFRARNPGVFGDDPAVERLLARALAGEVVAGTALFSPEELLKEGADLVRQATIEVVETPRARPSDKQVGRSGMLLVSSAPVRDTAGRIAGALYGGVLLNGNNHLVDRIKRIVYEGVQFQGEDAGTATIFLDDLRINTNVQTRGGGRAIGTRLSEEVYNHVIVNGKKWVDPAFVVKDWYFSAYEPILDLDGKVVGSLYVGMLGKPYSAIKQKVTLIFCGVLLFGSLVGLAVSGLIGSHLSRPIRELQGLVRRFSAGERDVRIAVTTGDEIGNLAGEFNNMTRTLVQREEEIRSLNRELEQKVRERTAELEEKNILLIKTREELVRAEKLAAVGVLAAGVAHEINNPMAIIRGNAELLQMAIPPQSPNREEADTIALQVGRVERIVASLLQFARRERKHLARTDINRLLDEILAQVGHQAPLAGIAVRKEYALELPQISGDADQLRQVFTNLILNAVQAMPGGGTLTVATEEDVPAEVCVVTVGDTGKGIEQENLEQIFNPFFTTRASGTGLGLSVSYGIVKDHGGRIEVTSERDRGSVFRVSLPLALANR